MKVYSIGREAGCNIVINDNTDVISRRHAILNVSSSGKMTIVDQSHNGTYVNGIRISPNVPVPVTRKDNISFAHVARLDWNLVPKSNTIMLYAIIAVAAIIVVVGGVLGYNAINNGHGAENNVPVATDSINPKTEQQIKKEINDSLNKVKAKEDSIARKRNEGEKKVKNKKDSSSSKKTEKKEDQKPKEQKDKETKKTFR